MIEQPDQHAAHDGDRSGHPVAHAGGSGGHGDHAAAADHSTHDVHAHHSAEMFRRKFWVALVLTIPTLIWGEMVPMLFGFTPPVVPGARWIPVVLGTAVFFYGGWVFLQGAVHELEARLPGMMTLISLAISVAFLYSVAATVGLVEGMTLWWELASLVTIMLLGHWLEMRSIDQASGAVKELAKLLPSTATRVTSDGNTESVPLAELREGDLLLVRPGSAVPADGLVRGGRSDVDESMITGESRPVTREEGDEVVAGTVNGSGSLRISVTRTGDSTALAGIMRLVEQAQGSRSRAQALADRAARLLTAVALGAAILTAIGWTVVGAEPSFIIERVVTVLVIACPHALGLAIPLVVAISTTIGARHGLLVRDRRGLEEARLLDTVVFDKTGTLTLGEHRVIDMQTSGRLSDDDALRLAAAVEADAEHPVARAIVASARERQLRVPHAHGFRALAGRGVEAVVDGRSLAVGGPNLLDEKGAGPGEPLRRFMEDAASRGQGVVNLLDGNDVLAAFAVADAVRPESTEAVSRLRKAGVTVAMLTGDSPAVAEAVAAELGIDRVMARVLPDEKATRIRELQGGSGRGARRVAMVGDGVNDAPALVTSDVGIAIGAGTDVAVEAGDVVLVSNDPRGVARIIELSKATYRKMIQNLWWAAGYNILAIPLAAGVLHGWGIVLSPALGAVLMSVSTIVVAINAQTLRRWGSA